jgi:hypothetical protein
MRSEQIRVISVLTCSNAARHLKPERSRSDPHFIHAIRASFVSKEASRDGPEKKIPGCCAAEDDRLGRLLRSPG